MKVTTTVTQVVITAFFAICWQFFVYGQPFVPFENNGKWGYKNAQTGAKQVTNLDKAYPLRNGVAIAIKDGKWGAYDQRMAQLIEFDFSEIRLLTSEIVIARKGAQHFAFDLKGQLISSKPFSDINKFEQNTDTLVVADMGGKYGLMHRSGKMLIEMNYSTPPRPLLKGHLGFTRYQKGQYCEGVCSINGEIIVPFKYLFIRKYRENLYQGETLNNEYHYYTNEGELVYKGKKRLSHMDSTYLILYTDANQTLVIRRSGKQIDAERWSRNNQFICGSPNDSKTLVFSGTKRPIELKGKWRLGRVYGDYFSIRKDTEESTRLFGLMNQKGKQLLKPIYHSIEQWNARWAVVRPPDNARILRLIDIESGKQALTGDYGKIELLDCDYVRLHNGQKEMILDNNLREVSSETLKKKNIYYVLDKKTLNQLRHGYLRLTGKEITTGMESSENCLNRENRVRTFYKVELLLNKYSRDPLPDRLIATYNESGKYGMGILNFQGKVIVPFDFTSIGRHENGLIPAAKKQPSVKKSAWGLINSDGQEIIPFQYDQIVEITENNVVVREHGLFNLINLKTKKTVAEGYNRIRYNQHGHFHLTKFGKKGVCDKNGKIIVPVKYDEVFYKMDEGKLYRVERDKKNFFVDQYGNEHPVP